MKINILTLFPEMFDHVLGTSIIGRAKEKGILDINILNIRDYTDDKHNRVDDYPFGGGQGMVMKPQPAFAALDDIDAKGKRAIYMSPRGRVMDMEYLFNLAQEEEIVVLCGHYEGVDQRILDEYNMEEVSIGDYVLTGGEIPCMALVDAVSRLIPGVLPREDSALDESIYSGLLEYPQYSQPREYMGIGVPDVLVSGNHRKIELWKYEQSLRITKERRPDLFEKYVSSIIEEENRQRMEGIKKPKVLGKEERKILESISGK